MISERKRGSRNHGNASTITGRVFELNTTARHSGKLARSSTERIGIRLVLVDVDD